jgi:mono/diheme cytochrome c family protein
MNTTKQTDLNQNKIKRMKKLMVVSLALLVAGAVSVRAADAKELWEKSCAKCHGPDGAGKTKMGEKLGVKDYTDAKVQESLKDVEMTKAIKEGVKEKDSDKTKMKAFSDLSDDEVKALVAQVRSFKK